MRDPAPPLSAVERATVAKFDAAEPAPVSITERVAVALHQEQNRGARWDLAAERVRAEYRRLAAAALDVLKGPGNAAGSPQSDAGATVRIHVPPNDPGANEGVA